MDNKKYAHPKKNLVRNIQVPLGHTTGKIKASKCCKPTIDMISDVLPTPGPSNSEKCINMNELPTPNDKYSKPELNTCLKHIKRMKDIKHMKVKPIETEGDLTPRSKQVYRHEITKVLNLPVNKKIYHHLIPLNVNDSMIMQRKNKTIQNTYVPGTRTDLEPQLEDFLTQITPIRMTFPMSEDLCVVSKANTQANFNYLQRLYSTYGPDS